MKGAPIRGATSASHQPRSSRTALATNKSGTKVAGGVRRRIVDENPTSAIEKADVATTIAGSEVMSRLAR
jgi:hypothetical protein